LRLGVQAGQKGDAAIAQQFEMPATREAAKRNAAESVSCGSEGFWISFQVFFN
jgi:hypothetical protein